MKPTQNAYSLLAVSRLLETQPSHLQQTLLMRHAGQRSNSALQKLMLLQRQPTGEDIDALPDETGADSLQIPAQHNAYPGGAGPGMIKNATEESYDVHGKKLVDLLPQLKRFDGFAAETYAELGIANNVTPQKVDQLFQIEVKWVIPKVLVRLPRWVDYDKASAVERAEWDRYMKQARRHEQEAHVDMALKFVEELTTDDTIIRGKSVKELRQKLSQKQVALKKLLQLKHDACDHGVAIDAVLHLPNTNTQSTRKP